MKKIAILVLVFVLAVGLMTACGGRNMNETSAPSTNATTVPTTAATKPTTKPTTQPTTGTTVPPSSGMLEDGMIDGNGDAGNGSGKVGRRP